MQIPERERGWWRPGGVVVALSSGMYGAVLYWDGLAGAFERLWGARSVIETALPWLWILGVVFGVAIMITGDPRAWLAKSYRSRQREWSLSEACMYVGTESVWARECPTASASWNTELPRAIIDAASLGRVRGTGRRPAVEPHHYDVRRALARTSIPTDFWEGAHFQAIPQVIDQQAYDLRNVLYAKSGGLMPKFVDVMLDKRDVLREWPRRPPWDKFTSPIAQERTRSSSNDS